jgi:perosamine synthetase
MTEPIPLSSQDITDAEIQAVVETLRSGRLALGPRMQAFEAALAERSGRTYGIAVNSGTSGLHLCVRALGLADGDEVVTTPFSFIATTNCILFERATPVLVDIDPASYNLDPAAAEAALTDRTKALLPVEAFGNTAHFGAYEQLARKHNLAMIEDCCEALGGVLNDRPAGNFGDCGVFAFYPNKQITTGEGGMIVTDREDLRDLCVSMRNQGRGSDAWLEHARLGYNYRMSEVAAALGEVQAARLDDILARRRQAAGLYDQALAPLAKKGLLHLPPMTHREQASWFVYVIRLADEVTRDQRDALMHQLREQGIGCNCYFVPIHTQPYIMERLGTKRGNFPITERIADRTLALPFFANISESQIGRVVDSIQTLLDTILSPSSNVTT